MASLLEQSLELVSTLPDEIVRNLHLLGDLDEGAVDELIALKEAQAIFLKELRAKMEQSSEKSGEEVLGMHEDSLEGLERRRESALQKAEERVAVAEQSCSVLEAKLKDLRELMFQCEDRLREENEFDVSRLDVGTPLRHGKVTADMRHQAGLYRNFAFEALDGGFAGEPPTPQFHHHHAPIESDFGAESGGDFGEVGAGAPYRDHGGGVSGGAAALPPPASSAAAMDLIPTDPKERYCYCDRGGAYDQMIGCDNAKCPIGQGWFHLSCVGVAQPPEGSWYCPTCAQARGITGMPGTIPKEFHPKLKLNST